MERTCFKHAMDFTRLFDIPTYQLHRYPQSEALSGIQDGQWVSFSSAQICEQVDQLALGLYALGLRSGDRVAILATHSTPYCNLCDLAMLKLGVVVVPLHATSQPQTLASILHDCAASACWVSDPIMLEHLAEAKVDLKWLLLFPTLAWPDTLPKGQVAWEHIMDLAKGAALNLQLHSDGIKADSLASILYTSGTSGEPKGVMLSHQNLVSNIKSTLAVIPLNSQHRVLSFLPLSHVLERMVTYTYLAAGASVWYADQLDNLPRIFRKVRPHFFTAVPRVVERMYARIQERREHLWSVLRPVYDWAIETGMHFPSRGNLHFNLWQRLKFWLAELFVFQHIRRSLGGKVEGIIVGAAALDQSLARLFTSAGMPIREGYGLTETSPVLSFNRFEPGGTRYGTVGMAVPGVEIRIDQPNTDGDGEIQARGPNVMLGYFNRPEETREKFTTDGWLRTGDQGRLVDKHFLKITGRISEIFKTASGKFISPQKLEIALQGSAYIQQAMVLGLNKPYVTALIVPDFLALERWATQQKVHWTSPQYMVHNPRVEKLFRLEIEAVNTHLEPVERIKNWALIHETWTPTEGTLTPTLKLRRQAILDRHASEVEQLYKKLLGSNEE
jgi:long-chain acyl-CoA synthetase